jgi:hypothetical protein
MYIGLYVKYRLFLSSFGETSSFLNRLSRKKKFLKFHISWRTERHEEDNSRFFFPRNFAYVPNNDFSFFFEDTEPSIVLSYQVL